MTAPEDFLSTAEGRELTVRELLSHWGHTTRTHEASQEVRSALDAARLTTEPRFEDVYSSRDTVRIIAVAEAPQPAEPEAEADIEEAPVQVSLRVKDLPSARGGVVSVGPDDTLTEATTLMMSHGYSQLAVKDGALLRGAITWESISAATARGDDDDLRACLHESPEVIRADDELLTQVHRIRSAGFAFVENEARQLVGIVTTADLTDQFANLAGPFFLLSEIERRLRRQIVRICTVSEMKQRASRPNKVNSVNDLVFGDCQAIFNDTDLWCRLGWRMAQLIFVEKLDEVRRIRNEVMHFRPTRLSDENMLTLENFAKWLRNLDPLP